ncbi:MAG: hydrogenase nickel incorporation protein HypB [Clostridia bacterium]|nr:hydrogenase nickel incorporation protein HypB [Clostridia bacterium]
MEIYMIKEDILSRNNEQAKDVRQLLDDKDIFYVNLMSSPGAGKTTVLSKLIPPLSEKYKIGVIEADIDSDKDALAIERETGVRVIQMHTGGACHITCQMSLEALEALGTDGLDIIFLENIGNLVCPAEFDTGADLNLVLLSVPEGDDKPLKYPLMFEVANAVAVTKLDVAPIFDFSRENAVNNIRKRNADAKIFFTSALENTGIDELRQYIETEAIKKIRRD